MSLDTDRLRSLSSAATKGPWTTTNGAIWSYADIGPVLITSSLHSKSWRADAQLICEARTALPELVDEVERLRGIVRTQRQELDLLRHVNSRLVDPDEERE